MWSFSQLMRGHARSGSAVIALIQRTLQPNLLFSGVRSTHSFSPFHIPFSSSIPSLSFTTSLFPPVSSSTPLPSATYSTASHFGATAWAPKPPLQRALFSSLAFPNARLSFAGPFQSSGGALRTFAAVPRRADGHVDIAAKARARQTQKLWRLVGGGAVVAGFGAFVLNAFQENLVFYITPTQAMATLSEQGTGPHPQRRLRLGGLVLDHSVRHFRNSTEMEFVVTDLATELVVRYRGALPDLFREGHSVVVEGFLRRGEVEEPGEAIPGQLEAADPSISKQTGLGMEGQTAGGERVPGCYFAATEVLAKHDEKYMPKEVAAVVAANKAAIELEKGLTPAFAREEERTQKPTKQKMGQQPVQVQQYELKL